MIKHSVKDNILSVSIANKDFSYRIPLNKIKNTIDWKIGNKDTDGIVIKNVSKWALQLFTKNITEEKYVKQFKDIVKEHCPNNTLNWQETILAINIQNKYNWLNSSKDKSSESEIITELKSRFKLD